jgi:hypothetical protein
VLSVPHRFCCHLHHYNIHLLCPPMKQCNFGFTYKQMKFNWSDVKYGWTEMNFKNIKFITMLLLDYTQAFHFLMSDGKHIECICVSIYTFHCNILQSFLTTWQGNVHERNRKRSCTCNLMLHVIYGALWVSACGEGGGAVGVTFSFLICVNVVCMLLVLTLSYFSS